MLQSPLLFLLLVAMISLISAFVSTNQAKEYLAKLKSKTKPSIAIPKAIGMLIVVSELSELARTIEHLTVLGVITTILLAGIWLGSRSGTIEDGL